MLKASFQLLLPIILILIPIHGGVEGMSFPLGFEYIGVDFTKLQLDSLEKLMYLINLNNPSDSFIQWYIKYRYVILVP